MNNNIEGHGSYVAEDCVYIGQFIDNVKQGFGVYTWNDGREYEGHFSGDLKHGFGTMKWTDGYAFSGQWENGYRHGQGTVIWPDGAEQEVEFANDRPLKILKKKRSKSKSDAGSEAGDAWFFCGTLEDILSSVFPQIFLASCEGFRATAKMCPVLNGDARPSDYLPLI